jgi:hypothetical protein
MKKALNNWMGRVVAGAMVAGGMGVVMAFPPAPHHLVHGLVRDDLGNTLDDPAAWVLFEVGGVTVARASVLEDASPDGNYRLVVPMDSGVTSQRYQPTAQMPLMPFRMQVRIGDKVYLPMEMVGGSGLVTRPGGVDRLDLTLGVDSDGDGLPDAWEWMLIAATGGGRTLADIRPEDDDDGDGMSNLQEYLAGTYAFDPEDGFLLAIRGVEEGRTRLEFLAIRGRTYTIHASTDMVQWRPVGFRVGNGPEVGWHFATQVQPMSVTVAPEIPTHPDTPPTPRFFKVLVR